MGRVGLDLRNPLFAFTLMSHGFFQRLWFLGATVGGQTRDDLAPLALKSSSQHARATRQYGDGCTWGIPKMDTALARRLQGCVVRSFCDARDNRIAGGFVGRG